MLKSLLFGLFCLSLSVTASAQDVFKDVPTYHWAYQAVVRMQQRGYMMGSPSGYFWGNKSVPRDIAAHELFREITNLEKMKDLHYERPKAKQAPMLTDVPPDYTPSAPFDGSPDPEIRAEIIDLTSRGIFIPRADGLFHGHEPITRYEAVQAIYNAFKSVIKLYPIKITGAPKDAAHDKSHPAYTAIIALYARGILSLEDQKGQFNGDKPMNHYEYAYALDALLDRTQSNPKVSNQPPPKPK